MDRYVYGDLPNKPGWMRIVDMQWNVTCDYEKGKFNETQRISQTGLLEKHPEAAATVMRELGEFVVENKIY